MKDGIIIIAAPSGAGKSSFLERILAEIPLLEDIVTFTTRKMRKLESAGKPYHFISIEKFNQLRDEGFFVEWAQVHDHFYGTSLEDIKQAWKKGRVAIMDVDVQGADTLKSKLPQAKRIFIMPPSIDVLRYRLELRDGKGARDLGVRLQNAVKEIARAGEFDYQVLNDDFEASYLVFKKIVEELVAES